MMEGSFDHQMPNASQVNVIILLPQQHSGSLFSSPCFWKKHSRENKSFDKKDSWKIVESYLGGNGTTCHSRLTAANSPWPVHQYQLATGQLVMALIVGELAVGQVNNSI